MESLIVIGFFFWVLGVLLGPKDDATDRAASPRQTHVAPPPTGRPPPEFDEYGQRK